ncbi:MAG: hypothetical protein UX51_C0029G0009 [Candidatus Azambacteria bacterium GW2011_GWF2_46_32]|uniref:Uncharacterized protein n=1 Tax=Candidatus Azambacteria bacterium GW2011_GWF2_46_32 TaxID=1618628 RepID=A0A0G1S4V0_9BACT|nr:MAG: hypothetical protein UX51_C0029G0009 [Candidatus Azambacteria bacterium GW2011_GWF2_46_32]
MNPEKPKLSQVQSGTKKEIVKNPKTEGKLELETPQETMERLAKEAVKKPEEKKIGEGKEAAEEKLKTVAESTSEKAIKYLSGEWLPGKEEGPEKKGKEEKVKKEEAESRELYLKNRLEEARNILAGLSEKSPLREIAFNKYKDQRDALRNFLFQNKEAELKDAPKEQAEVALSSFAGELFEKLYIEEAQNLRARQLEIKVEKSKDHWISNIENCL